jgi:2-methylcitrate dehydratase PrpD
VARTEELFLDWVSSAFAGRNARPVEALERFAQTMGPDGGPSEILVSRRRSSPLFAALAAAQQTGASGRDFITASVAGYETGVRVGTFLGRSHYQVFHTTGTAGTLAAAAAVAHLLGSDGVTILHALGSAGTQAAGLWEFLRDAADSKQLHTAKAAAAASSPRISPATG